ncbi:n-alpha-acetyltransferase 30 [Holotrichia oblita]|uniref:N-alpha-acetyltransferase 30 n=1 Tax=Holotrichia oblita TaxID=644536 RepID=A0ACB9T824_HOLOL|nr:n-alpha-acetyltransferase 30 [Holotrichia oblita]
MLMVWKNNKNVSKSVDLEDKKYNSLVDNVEEINNINVANGKDTSSHRLESVPSTSDTTKKCDESDLKLTKSKSKSKKADTEKPCSSSSSSKSDTKSKADDLDSSDFDITAYIRSKYGSDIKEDKEVEKEEVAESEKMTDSSIEKVENMLESDPGESLKTENPKIEYVQYQSELQMPMIMKIIQKDLSEPYSIYTYRYFIHNWPNLCFLAMCEDECVGAIVCKLDLHRKQINRGYIAMLAVDKKYRKHGIGSTLVRRAIQEMIAGNADEVVLETEITNKPALRLYEALGFVRDKRLFRYYLNGVDALRLKLWLR